MSIPSTPSSLTVPITRHKGYFIHEADVTIRVRRIYLYPLLASTIAAWHI